MTKLSAGWEPTFVAWARPASDREDQKKNRAVTMITAAIQLDGTLPSSVRVYAKGSYANNTNVRLDSDVDVAVEWTDFYYYEQIHGAEQLSKEQLGIVPSTNPMTPAQFKGEVQAALEKVFGTSAVTRHNRCLTVRESSVSLAADVVPCFTYRSFVGNPPTTRAGIAIYPDSGGRTSNWPQQNYDNGVAKNDATGRRYKKIVRILKRLENEMVEKAGAKSLRSYLIECLAYNVPNPVFGHAALTEDVHNALVSIYGSTKDDPSATNLVEINEIKYLFHPTQRWTRQDANAFIVGAMDYLMTKK